MKSKSEPNMEVTNTDAPASGNSTSSPERPRILFVDNDADRRKARIAILKQHGFMVYPALDLQQAGMRCRRGAYDVVIVNAASNMAAACELCDQIRRTDPRQLLLMMTDEHARFPSVTTRFQVPLKSC